MAPKRTIPSIWRAGIVLVLLFLAGLATVPRASAAPNACSTPRTRSIRGVQVIFDQCYERPFSHNGTDYEVNVYYTEANGATNLSQCPAVVNTPTNGTAPMDTDNDLNNDGIVDRCEHALPNNDDGNGDNVEAVAMGAEMESAVRFYDDRNLAFLPAGNTTMNVYIAEDPRVGGIISGDGIYVDDDWMLGDQLAKRLLAFHEGQHLVQSQYDDNIGWDDFYGEGIARAIEDRIDPTLDADLGHLFIPEVNGILGSDGNRSSDITTINYRSVLWWTWLWDRYRAGADVDPVVGWQALRDFYLELKTESDDWKAAKDFIGAQGGSPFSDFIDYTLALWAHKFSPSDERLSFLDNEIRNNANSMSGHSVINGGPSFATVNQPMNPRSSRYWEFNPASQCDFVAYTFDGQGDTYGFSVMTTGGGSLQDRWTTQSAAWARTVRTAPYDRVVGVVTALDSASSVEIGYGCVTPTLTIKMPTTSAFAMVGNADNPRKFIVRVDVTGEDGSGVAGLTASDFAVTLTKSSGGSPIAAAIVSAVYVQDDYWLLVQAPSDADGAETGQFYNVSVDLGSISDTNNSAVLYVERTQDVVIVLDRSGSMGGTTGKIEAARNAANLLTNELSEDDQGGFVAFDDNAYLRESLAPMTPGHRSNMEVKIAAETPGGATSIGDGMLLAAQEHDANKEADNVCSFVLLSDGHENTAAFWADIRDQVVDNECPIHTIALGPGTNEVLLQQIAASVPGGSYDYATASGGVPISTAAVNAAAVNAGTLGWQNNLSRIYDAKMARIAGRQRIYSAVGDPKQTPGGSYRFYVDDATDTLVVSTAWQTPFTGEFTFQFTQLFDPDGNPIDAARLQKGDSGTSEVWRVPAPQEGYWSLRVIELFEEYYVSATALTGYELYLLIGTPVGDLIQAVDVPIFGVLVGPDGPLTGADVVAQVQRPNGVIDTFVLEDDGAHGDVEANDGIYAALYTITGLADTVIDEPEKVVENEEPQVTGSYQVTLRSVYKQMVREAQDSFAIAQDRDTDADGMPDEYEKRNGLDPEDPADAREDLDGDRLLNVCECQYGTDLRNPDTDDGGEADGSEVPSTIDEFNRCRPTVRQIRNPLDPADDRGGKISVVRVTPELTVEALPFIHVFWSLPDNGQLRSVEIWRRLVKEGVPAGEWEIIAMAATGQDYEDMDVEEGMAYQYRLVPTVVVDGEGYLGTVMESNASTVKDDPYAPTGSILINDGDAETTSTLVTLFLTADDSGGGHTGDDTPSPVGTPANELEMLLSNRADFTGAEWQPFQALVEEWELGAPADGDVVTVYVQFRDKAGNVGESGFAQMDSITYREPSGPTGPQNPVFLPLVYR